MLITKKMLLALTLVAALIGGTVGALITHSSKAANETATSSTPADANQSANQQNNEIADQTAAANNEVFKTPAEQTAYREGFNDCSQAINGAATTSNASRVAYRTGSPSRRVYYDYSQPTHGRTFWQKHRDKLTLAIGTGSGALIGGLIGGKKGAGIGALAGLGGSALYTYKLRHRHHPR
jgi:uncharacterized protein YdbL (DUF1318 family)